MINEVGEDKDAVVMEVGTCKGKQNLEVNFRPFVPLRNIRGRGRDSRYILVLEHIGKK